MADFLIFYKDASNGQKFDLWVAISLPADRGFIPLSTSDYSAFIKILIHSYKRLKRILFQPQLTGNGDRIKWWAT